MRYKDSVKLYSMVTRGIGIDFTIYNRDCKLLSFPLEIAYINLTLIKLESACIEPVHNPHQLLLHCAFRTAKPGYHRAQTQYCHHCLSLFHTLSKSLMSLSDPRLYEWYLKVVWPECVSLEAERRAHGNDPASLGIKWKCLAEQIQWGEQNVWLGSTLEARKGSSSSYWRKLG